MSQRLIEKLRKLEALASRGVEGERANAQRMLEAFKRKHGEKLVTLSRRKKWAGLGWYKIGGRWLLTTRQREDVYDFPIAGVERWPSGRWEWIVVEDLIESDGNHGYEPSRRLAMDAAERALNLTDVPRPDDEHELRGGKPLALK